MRFTTGGKSADGKVNVVSGCRRVIEFAVASVFARRRANNANEK
jgi:hypothetical protein